MKYIFLFISLFLLQSITWSQTQYAYVRSVTGQPWGNNSNEDAMNEVFGVSNWDDLRYETVDINTLIAGRSFIFMEGSDGNANELEAFLTSHISVLENWVNAGGNLFLNAGPNEGNGMSFGFGGTTLNYSDPASNVVADDLGHPIFSGPFLPVGTAWSGNSFSHASISGTGLNNLIVDASNASKIVLAYKQWGGGKAFFGGMTTYNFHSPNIEAKNLRKNILDFLQFNPVPLDAGVASLDEPTNFCAGMHDVITTIANFGTDTIFDVMVNWAFNDTLQPVIHYMTPMDTIGSGNNTASINLGSKNFVLGQTYDIKIWTSAPNGMMDTVNVNDTLLMTVSPGLAGTLTIGGASPDFNTFAEAVNFLNTFGICGAVTFNVRNGTYNEQISLGEILGADTLNTVTFQSESGDSSLVVLTFSSSLSTENYTLRMDGADWVTFRKMTIEATGTNYAHAIEITNSSNRNTFENNIFKGISTTSSTTNRAVVYSSSSFINEYNVFNNNWVQDGSYGIYLEGSWNNGNYISGTEVTNNYFEDQYYYGAYLYYQNAPIVNYNSVTNTSSANGSVGLYLTDCYNGTEVLSNQIIGIEDGHGIYLSFVSGTAIDQCLVANNFVQMQGSGNYFGIYSYYGNYHNILYNTVHLTNTSPSASSFKAQYGNDKVVLNNIFANFGGGYAMDFTNTTAVTNSDYNNLYSTGLNLNYWGGTLLESLVDWQALTTFDLHSLSVNPQFTAQNNYPLTQIDLNAAAFPSPFIMYDIEGEMRDATNPDIGADEWTPPPLDAALIDFNNPTAPFVAGSQSIEVILKNSGTTALTSVDIDLEVNNVAQTTVNWTGSLASGDTAWVNLATTNFIAGQTYDLESWVSNPNGMADPQPANDTIVSLNLSPGLGGIYTIGGVTPDFVTFTEAINTMTLGGIVDSVTFLVRDGIYNEQLSIGQINGVDSLNRVVFRSESGDSTSVTLTYSSNFSDNYTLRFSGADYITFCEMTLEATNTTYGCVVEVTNESNYICLENNILKGVDVNTTSTGRSVVFSTSSYMNEHFKMRNNHVLDGSYGLYFSANTAHVNGTEIIGNTFTNQYYMGIFMDEHNTPKINDNVITTDTPYSGYYGIYSNDSNLGGEVRRNRVYGNTIWIGIYLRDMEGGTNDRSWVTNNFVEIGNGYPTNEVHGLYTSSSGYQNIYYNTVNISNTFSSSRAFYSTSDFQNQLLNNLFSNAGGGYAFYNNSGTGILSSDYNNLYTTGSTLLYWGANYATLEDWLNGGGSTEMNSLSEPPYFLAPFSYQIAQSALNGAAMPDPSVLTDIEGDLRDATNPDIGADEFMLAQFDAGITGLVAPDKPFVTGKHLMKAALRNHGLDTIQSVTINWRVNGVVQTAVNWTGVLLSTDSVLVDLDSVDFTIGQAFDIEAWTTNPNGVADLIVVNDTSSVENLYAGLGGTYTIGGVAPDFLNFTTAVDVLNTGGVVSATTFNVRDGVYNEQLVLTEICGVDTLNQVVFQSESGDSSAVTLTYDANSSANYTIRIEGADWVTFKQVTISSIDLTYNMIIRMLGGADHIDFYNNVFDNASTNYTSIYVEPGLNEYHTYRNNVFIQGYNAIAHEGIYNNANYNAGLIVENNIFTDQYNAAIWTNNQNHPVIMYNQMDDMRNGMYLNGCYFAPQIIGNRLSNIEFNGIYLDFNNGSLATPGLIANNFVHVLGTANANGIYLYYGSYLNVYHNNVNMTNTNTASRAFQSVWGNDKRLLNNIFSNPGGGYSIYANTSSAITWSNHNDLYTTGTNLGYQGNNQTDLTAWIMATGMDTSSLSLIPGFVSDTNLHINNVALDKAGTPVPEVTTDIDGQFRDPTFPDIGADEFSTAQDDAGILSIDSPVMPFATGSQNIDVTLLNNGLDTLESVTINWEVNGLAQPAFNWTGMLLSGTTEDSLNLGTFTFEIDTAYTIRAWTSNPNGMVDTETFNDTSEVNNLYAALSGVYTLGGTSPDFIDFTHSVNSLINGGVIGAVTINVRTGVYDEQISIPEILGVDSMNTVTYQSEVGDSSQVTLTYSAPTNTDNYVLKLDGADWLRVQKMTLKNEHTNYARVIDIRNGADNNRFENNEIIGRNVVSTSANFALVYSNDWKDDYNTFAYNRFIEGNYGLYYLGDGTSGLEEGTIIMNNSFENQVYRSILIQYQNAPYIAYNEINSDETYFSYYGIYTYWVRNATKIVNNNIWGIPAGDGIGMDASDGTSSEYALIANNFIHLGFSNHTTAMYGIYNISSDYLKVYNNNVHIVSNTSSSYAFFSSNANNTIIKNNVLANTDLGRAFYKNGGSNLTTDYNDLYTTDTYLGYWDGTDAVDLPAWQAASSQDANSHSVDPKFTANDDLHVDAVDLNLTGMPVPEVTDDFDGDPRHPTTPDIGADEFFPMTMHDASVEAIISPSKNIPFPEGVQPVQVAIKNNGIDTMLNVTIEWRANGLPQISYNWLGYLLPGALDTVTIGSHNFTLNFGNDLEANTKNPNSAPDNNPGNDTTAVLDLYPALDGVYTIGGAFPDFNSFSAAANGLNQGGVLGQVTFMVRNGTYNEQIELNEINGASITNTITFQSESGDSSLVKMERSNSWFNNYLVRLNGTDYTTFKQMTFRTLGSNYNTIFELMNGANYNAILNNHLIDTDVRFDETILGSSTSLDNYNTIENNRIEGGGYGIYFYGQNSGTLESGTRIINNVFENQYYSGILLNYQNAPEITQNEMTTNRGYNSYDGIYCGYCDNDMMVLRNKISGGYGFGIYLYRCDGTASKRSLTANNFVQVGGMSAAYGIYSSTGFFQNIYNNSVNITNTDAASTAFYSSSGGNKNLLNNIFSNPGGGYASYVTSSSGISSQNFNNYYTTGANLGYWVGNTATNLAFWQAISGKDLNAVSANPLYFSDTDLHALQVAMDSAATSLALVMYDIDGEPRDATHPDIGADEFDFLEDDLGIVSIIAPADDCDLTNAEAVTVAIQNYGGLPQTGFDISYGFTNGASVMENVGGLTVEPGDTAHFTFSTPIDVSNYLTYPLESATMLAGDLNPDNDDFMAMVTNHQTPVMVSNMLPSNGTINVDPPINFSWLPSQGATRYDLYLWEENVPVPTMPVGQDLSQITYAYNNNSLIFGATYNWQVIAKNDFCETAGPIQAFTLRELPDLIVNNVGVPNSPFSGQSIEVTWEVNNMAIGNTGMTTWYDYLYLSSDNVYQPGVDTYLGGFANLTALNSMMSYSQMKNVTLPQGIQGTYYIFVVTDRNNNVIEGNDNNNVSVAASMPVTLTPPPDLQVTSIIIPNNAFSNSSINVIWTVTNNGTGDVPLGNTFRDRIYFSDSENFSQAASTYLGQYFSDPIPVGASHTRTKAVTLPQGIFGDHFIHIITDYHNHVFEFAFENNNTSTSDTLNVILTPPPDLVVQNIIAPDSVDNKEAVVLNWTVKNQGATNTGGGFYDRVYMSSYDMYHPDSVTYLGQFYTSSIIAIGDSINRAGSVSVPNDVFGKQYFYVYTDALNHIFEFNTEGNNITRSDAVCALNADLIVSNITVADTTYSGTSVIVEWNVENQGAGNVGSFTKIDKIYISPDSVYNAMTSTEIGSLSYNDALSAGQSLMKQKMVTIPNGLSGNHYIQVRTDVNNSVYEHNNEDNNDRTDSTWVKLSPWPDLQVDTLKMLPMIATAGELLTVEWDVTNYGTANVLGATAWTDRVYISANPTWNLGAAVQLKNVQVQEVVNVNGTYTKSVSFILPMLGGGATSGICYIYVFADATNKIYEHTDENNNTKRSNPISVTAPEPVDFKVLSATTLPDTVWSGQQTNLQWMIRNDGSTTGLWGYPLWYDGIYLSTDSTLSYNGDLFVKDFTKQGPVGNMEMYTQNQNFNIPHGISGDYYVFLSADHTHLTNNVSDDTSKWKVRPASYPNGQFKPIHVKLSPSPDLLVSTMVAPASGVSGQPIQVIWTVQNNGLGATSGTWTDKIYLSTDFNIDNSDPIIATKSQNLVVPSGGSYTDTINAFIPINKVGNFVLILKTDANNNLFEFNGEDNNSFFNFLTTSLPLPSDLVINNATYDSTAMVGEQFTVDYTILNQGTNPATGFMQELIYFSADSIFDASDVKHVDPINRNINLAPALTLNHSASELTPGVPLGDYFVIVHTDILNNIYENSDTNNIYISPEKVSVTIQELPLDSLMADTLENNLGIYYRIEIPDTLENETMLVTLDGHTTGGVNELYLSHNAVPTRSVHDFSFTDPFTEDQEIIVPEILPGTYYLLAYGATNYIPAYGEQMIDLKAEIVPFQIREVMANKGGNTGTVTVKIEGAKFESDMELRLEGDSATAVGQNMVFINSTTVFVTFNLAAGFYISNWETRGLNSGLYDVVAEKTNGEIATLVDGFEVLEGTAPNFSVSLTHPPNTRINRTVAMTLNYGNNGDVDIAIPKISIISLRGAPVALTPEDLSFGFQDISVELGEEGGPTDVLRPGAIGSLTIYAKSSAPMTFKLVRLE